MENPWKAADTAPLNSEVIVAGMSENYRGCRLWFAGKAIFNGSDWTSTEPYMTGKEKLGIVYWMPINTK